MSTPTSHRVWKYASASGGLENHLKLHSVPIPVPRPNEHLIKVIATALNPVDYKPAEAPLVGGFLVKKPATPGIDIAGRVVAPASGSSLKQGQLVFGVADSTAFAAGGLAEYVATIVPHVKAGDRILLNGGSGGVGLFGIQIAKAIGCHVAVTCSSKNVDFVKSYGADEVVDYTKGDVVSQLAKLKPFDHVVDNVGSPRSLYFRAHEYTKPQAQYHCVAFSPTLSDFGFAARAMLLPSFLGGGKRKFATFFAQLTQKDMETIVNFMAEGKVKAVIDSRHAFEAAPEAMRRQKTGRARGKIIVDVAPME